MKITKTATLTALGIIIAAAGVVLGLELSDTTHWFHDKPVPTVKINDGQTASADPDVPGGEDKQYKSTGSSEVPGFFDQKGENREPAPSHAPAGLQPDTPSGQFVSNHRPNLDADPLPNNEGSICITTPGVTCIIKFTSGDGISKSLSSQLTSPNGSASWNWTLQDVGLTVGTWTVTAIAKNGDKVARMTDPIKLEVKP